jgi:hypothetical protein
MGVALNHIFGMRVAFSAPVNGGFELETAERREKRLAGCGWGSIV